ncbi:hypothetical protein DFP72DRAFT_363274 [Ephemerocybe angulata]|uniref:MYND-type domain-containing protein n=1 Tax=Ephemerocybe angulata TaxID=980116 RepID=A0A8H6HYL3_9AGAR|nr:hypothetical protein DFP72DRAFT_363274 [Tulosesus angulatus]
MSNKRTRDIENLLANVRLGSEKHVNQLYKNWPAKHTIQAAAALNSLLTVEKLPKLGGLDLEGWGLAQSCFFAFAKALEVPPARYQGSGPPLWIIFRDNIEGITSWMSLCVQQVGESATLHEIIQGAVFLTVDTFNRLLGVPELKEPLQTSTSAAAFVAMIWRYISPQSGKPFYVVEQAEQPFRLGPDGKPFEIFTVDGIHDLVQYYTNDSKTAKEAFILHLSQDGSPESGADQFVQIAVARAQRMAEFCKIPTKWEGEALAKDLKHFSSTLGGILALGNPVYIAPFRRHKILYEFMCTLCSYVRHLKRHSDSEECLSYSRWVLWDMQQWTDIPGVATTTIAAVCQLVKGGLLSVYLNFLIHESWVQERRFKEACRQLGKWIANYSFYPSVHAAIMDALGRVDQNSLRELLNRKEDHWTRLQWAALSYPIYNLGRPAMRLVESNKANICNNPSHASTNGILSNTSDPFITLQACSSCHLAVYCSIQCQKQDWSQSGHREDCPQLTKVYSGKANILFPFLQLHSTIIERVHAASWLHTSTRIFHLAILQETYRRSAKAGRLEAVRRATNPITPLNLLVICFDFVDSPATPEDTPKLKRIFDLLEEFKAKDGRGRLIAHSLGVRRVESIVSGAQEPAETLLVEGKFKFRKQVVYVLASLQVVRGGDGLENPDLATVLGGTSRIVTPTKS